MEPFAVALFGAVASTALAKLRTVIDEELSKKLPETDATFIIDELTWIEAIIKAGYASNGGHFSFLQTPCIGQLRRLAYDIEDCVDCFDANKTSPKEFADEISKLLTRSKNTREQIESYMGPIAQGVIGTAQVEDPVAEAPVVPRELQDLLDDPSRNHQEWLGRNLDCLLYFCLFPPEHDVRTKPLMRRWLAEGLVEEEQDADKNLEILIAASIINSTQTSNNGDVEICRPTEEMLQCISQRSRSQNFIVLCDGTVKSPVESTRRLSVYPSANGKLILPRTLSRLRTLAVFAGLPNYEDVLDFKRYGMLRVLDLKECDHMSDDHLWAICDQVLMKYLSINLGSIDSITRKFGFLEQLETLDLGGNKTVTVFKEVLLLPKLKHLLGRFQLSITDTPSVLGLVTSNLEKFLRKKSKLETLDGFVTCLRLGFPQLMRRMRMLRKVKIWCKPGASRNNLSAISRAIWKFSRVGTGEPHRRSISIHFQGCSAQFLNTEYSDAAKGRLDSLELRGHLSVFPKFVENLSVIQELCLWSTGLSWQHIRNGLSKVSGLKYLKIIDENLGVSVAALNIPIQADALSDLVSLHILCQNLAVIPGTPGIEIIHMKNLKEVALHHQVAGGIIAEWQKAVNDHANRPVLLSIEDP